MNTQLLSIKAKKFGVRLAGLRQNKGVTIDSLSQWTGIPKTELEMIENGETSISLPQIELLALKLGLGIDLLLLGKPEGQKKQAYDEVFNQRFSSLRDRVIALSLRKTRDEKNLTISEVSDQCGITEERLSSYETGTVPVPFPVLERICELYQIPVTSLTSSTGKPEEDADKERKQTQFSTDLERFIQNPANLPYLELAKRLSEIDAAKLRSIAEGLLEITY